MRKSDFWISTLILTVYQILSCMVIYFAVWMLMMLLGKLVILDYLVTSAIQATCLFVGVGAMILVYAYHTAYHAAAFSWKEYCLSALVATVIHAAIGAVFSYLPLLCGAASPLSGFLAFGSQYVSPEAHAQIPAYLPALIFLLMMVLYHLVSLPIGYFAQKRRLKDRFDLTGRTE